MCVSCKSCYFRKVVALLWGKRPTFANNCTSKVLICVHQSRGYISQIEETFIRCSTSVEKQCFKPPPSARQPSSTETLLDRSE